MFSPLPCSVIYADGHYYPASQAIVPVADRGYQFADGVYEVMAFYPGGIYHEEKHIQRLFHSLSILGIPALFSWPSLRVIVMEVIRRNRAQGGFLYLQITRGTQWPRAHVPSATLRPVVSVMLLGNRKPEESEYQQGISAITYPDQRWDLCSAKTIALLPSVLAKQAAQQAGAKEAILYDAQNHITEGSSTNCSIVDAAGVVHTHPATQAILNGVTRQVVLANAQQAGIQVIEQPFTRKMLQEAREVFVTSTTMGIMPVTKIDSIAVGQGKPGDITRRLMQLLNADKI